MGDGQRLRRESFKSAKPIRMPAPFVPPSRPWSDGEWLILQEGCRARVMEDKWYSYVESNRLYIHRSWTGMGMFECQFEPRDGAWIITEAVVESDPEVFKNKRPWDSDFLEFVIAGVLLKRGRSLA